MATLWENVVGTYNYLFDEISNPISKDWFLVQSPLPLIAILVSYNIFCTRIGPMLMKNRKPFELKKVIMLYNIFQVLISTYITYEGVVYIFFGNFNFKCQPVENTNVRVIRAVQVYFNVKLIELLDTIFFVLRKSNRQVTFLHLYHHTLMPSVTWIGLKYFPGGQGVIVGTINSFIHIIMYMYYFLSGLGPQYQKYLWWKKYLTVLQIVQFSIVLVHSVNSLFYPCEFHTILKLLTILESSTFIYMFSKFYYNSYVLKPKNSSNGVSEKNGHSINGNSKIHSKKNVESKKNSINGSSNGQNHINGYVQSSKKDK